MQYANPYIANPYMQQAIASPTMQQMIQQTPTVQQLQQQVGVRVSGREEAMNRFLMMYPAQMLVPGFISEALFDIDSRHFHTLSIELNGNRNLETFSYQLDMPVQTTNSDYVSRAEFNELLGKVNQMTGALNGIHEPVPAAAPADAAATA